MQKTGSHSNFLDIEKVNASPYKQDPFWDKSKFSTFANKRSVVAADASALMHAKDSNRINSSRYFAD
jgi:hypothetical protein